MSHRRNVRFVLPLFPVVLVLSAIFVSRPAQAWGPVGHRTIAYIAEDHLTPTTKQCIQSIIPNTSQRMQPLGEMLASVATWADDVRPFRQETAPWHYIDLPVHSNITVQALSAYCAASTNGDLLTQAKVQIEALKSQTVTGTNRLDALRFLIHFTGDMTMPFHCSDDEDRGGNEKIVRFYGPTGMRPRGNKMKLHALWDHLIQVECKENPRKLATKLEKKITQADIDAWTKGTPDEWVLDTYGVAKGTVYKGFAPGATPEGTEIRLPRGYYRKMRPVANEQVEKAGIRLAYLLNNIYDPGK